ncbi:uncharacterized protein LOC142350446 [Convolutriloba macropyga]|uniref:uncharacterized protein LOC142350446 n=1 Tax=Convolutriloba macropyga TaxID=536237 RepID=UPI003F5263FA
MQLISAYGKRGPVTSFKLATYTDVIDNSTSVGTNSLVLSVFFESGTGSQVKIRIKSQLGGMDRMYYFYFEQLNQFHFGNLEPGDRFTMNMWVTSKGDEDTAVVRNYTFYDSTYPTEPTIVTSITVTEHTIHFGWTNPLYFQVGKAKHLIVTY